MPPGLLYVFVASVGALALGVGAVAAIDGHPAGIALALGGAVLLFWSVQRSR
jgi:hypothetical protein